jgi:hypothetical protein
MAQTHLEQWRLGGASNRPLYPPDSQAPDPFEIFG